MISKSEYTARRLAGKGNDKVNREKLMDDAKLRGAIGTRKANKLISALDTYKTGCSSFDRFGNLKD